MLKSVLHKLYKPVVEFYLRKERTYRYRDLTLKIFPGVFHPGFFFSTKILLAYLEPVDLKNKTLLELGAGSGLIAIAAAKKGAVVTATDISKTALENISVNQELNRVSLQVFHSDLFDRVPQLVFDFLVINPPYFKGKIKHEASHAWYAGEHFDYFQKLFYQLPAYMNESSKALMILSDDCDISRIESIAAKNNFLMKTVYTKKVFPETNFIFEIHFLKN